MYMLKFKIHQKVFSGLLLALSGLLIGSCTRFRETPIQETVPTAAETATTEPAEAACRYIHPAETDPGISQWVEPHYICAPASKDQDSGELFLFLPGTGATPDFYTTLMETAAEAGLHVINLRYPNDKSVNLQLCPFDTDPDCHGKIRAETLRGESLSRHVAVDPDNSIEGRLRSALVYLDETNPEESWGRFLDEEGEPRWSLLIVSGHSQGGGHAVYLAMEHTVERAVAFAWADVRRGELAPWLIEKTSQTPPEDYYLFFHRDDDKVTRFLEALMGALGIDRYGERVIVDIQQPPYLGSHALMATAPPPEGERAHNTHIVDRALTFDEQGDPLYEEAWLYLLTLNAESNQREDQTASATQTRSSVPMGAAGAGYIDPEFYPEENLVAFADGFKRAWIGYLDPLSGDFLSGDGRDLLVDTDLVELAVSFNAPEFGVDQAGWSLFYTKENQGVPQIWRGQEGERGFIVEPLTAGKPTRLSVLASKDPSGEEVRLLFARGEPAPGIGEVAWLGESDPQGTETAVAPIDRGARWVDGTTMFTYVINDGPSPSQVVLYETSTGAAAMITNTPGDKSYAYGWWASEYDQLLVMTVVDDSRIEIYRDSGGDYWDLMHTLRIPVGSAYTVIGSPEPFTAGGKSYLSLIVKADGGYAPAEVWVWGLEEDKRFTLKCEDGLGEVIRTDPESYPGEEEIFLYYNVLGSGQPGERGFSLYRCATGITP